MEICGAPVLVWVILLAVLASFVFLVDIDSTFRGSIRPPEHPPRWENSKRKKKERKK